MGPRPDSFSGSVHNQNYFIFLTIFIFYSKLTTTIPTLNPMTPVVFINFQHQTAGEVGDMLHQHLIVPMVAIAINCQRITSPTSDYWQKLY
jgi:hypothetical protein